MYKIKEIADMLSVNQIKVVEAMVLYKDILEPYIIKEKRITFITEQGLKEFKKIIYKDSIDYLEADYEIDDEDDLIFKNIWKKKELLKDEIEKVKKHISELDAIIINKSREIKNYHQSFADDKINY